MPGQRRRRAVGPPGARPSSGAADPSGAGVVQPEPSPRDDAREDDDERLRAEQPPHHDRGV